MTKIILTALLVAFPLYGIADEGEPPDKQLGGEKATVAGGEIVDLALSSRSLEEWAAKRPEAEALISGQTR
jgi:hypothetical protein